MNRSYLEAEIRRWLDEFSSCVQHQDFQRGLSIFDNEVLGFGTFTGCMKGLEALHQQQWTHVWPSIREFQFDPASVCMWFGSDEKPTQCTVAVLWTSQGLAEDGCVFDRSGRATIVLICNEGRWVAIHTHFSLDP